MKSWAVLLLLVLASDARAARLDRPVWHGAPGDTALPAYRGDRLSLELSPPAAAAARSTIARAPGHAAPMPALGLPALDRVALALGDRKSTRLNSSHRCISYAV